MVERFDAEYDEDIGIIYRQSPNGGHVRFSAYATLEEKLAEALKALDKIANWPNGGNNYGQENIKRFALRALEGVE